MKRALAVVAILVAAILTSSCETMSMVTPWGPEIRTSWQGGVGYYSNLVVLRNDTEFPIVMTAGYAQSVIRPHTTYQFDVHSGWSNIYAAQNLSLLMTIAFPDGHSSSMTVNLYVDNYNRQIRTLVIEQNRQTRTISYH